MQVIIFAREKATVDLIERFLKGTYPTVKFVKLTSDIKES